MARRRGTTPLWPQAVVRPRSTDEVVDLVTWAGRTNCALVPYGGGSGVCTGISDPGRPAVVVDMGEMWRLLDLDAKSRLVRVEAGATGPQLRSALAESGWTTGHEPQSLEISTVGGWVATKACGQLSARYGGIEEMVVGLTAVLPDATVARSKTVPRRSAGPEVHRLLIGSEGTLGIVTDATLRISPVPSERSDVCLRFAHMAEGVASCRDLAQSDLNPTVVRLYDTEDSEIFLRNHPGTASGPLLILSFEGPRASERGQAAVRLCPRAEPGTPDLVAHWWDHRNDAVHEFRLLMGGEGLLGPHGLVETMEVSGTWTVLRDLYHDMKETLGASTDLIGCHLSHVYADGACLYFTLAAACNDDEEAHARLEGWWEEGMRVCLERGGSISHHHGIGRTKARWLEGELGGWMAVLRAVKQALDPKNIMNPGALGL